MLTEIYNSFSLLMGNGGWVMWPLLLLSLASVTLIVERIWFWSLTNGGTSLEALRKLRAALDEGDAGKVRQLASAKDGLYGRIAMMLLAGGGSDAAAAEAIESQRPRLERFMPLLSTIITVAPMLGILGTVVGIIESFGVFSEGKAVGLSDVSGGIAKALWSTAAGLVVAIFVLFPYNAFRAQIDRSLERVETLIAASKNGAASSGKSNEPARQDRKGGK
jgi:biopolymer transport protein ExbB